MNVIVICGLTPFYVMNTSINVKVWLVTLIQDFSLHQQNLRNDVQMSDMRQMFSHQSVSHPSLHADLTLLQCECVQYALYAAPHYYSDIPECTFASYLGLIQYLSVPVPQYGGIPEGETVK